MVDPSRAEALLRQPERLAALAEGIRHRDAHAHVAHLAVRVPGTAAVAHHRCGLSDLQPRCVGGHEDHRPALVGRSIRVRYREDDPERRAFRAAREPLVPVDHPLVAVEHCARPEERRVGACNVGLGHGEERAGASRDERLEEALVLIGRPELVQDLGVAGVGSLAAEDQLGPVRAADLLVHARVVEEAVSRPSGLGRHVRRPEARRARVVPQRLDQLLGGVVLTVEQALVRKHVLCHERAVLRAPLQVGGREEGRARTVCVAHLPASLRHGAPRPLHWRRPFLRARPPPLGYSGDNAAAGQRRQRHLAP